MRSRVALVLGVVFCAAILAAPAPASMEAPAWRTAAVAVLMATWWITEAVPLAVTALLPLVLLPVFGVMAIEPAAAPYANPVIFLFLGGFTLAAALQRSGLHLRMAINIIRVGGVQPRRLVGAFMAATAFTSMWVSNTATVAMMLPLALSVISLVDRKDGQDDETTESSFSVALLLGLAYAASIGGMGTLIGTPPNALLAGFMSETYGVEIGFVEWMLVGVPLVIVALPVTWLLLTVVLHRVSTEPIAGGSEVFRDQLRALGPPSRAEWTVGAVTALTAAAWVFRPLLAGVAPSLSDAGIAVGGAVLLFLIPTHWGRHEHALDWSDVERLPWGVLVLFGGGLSLAQAIQETGLANWIGVSLTAITVWPILPMTIVVTTVVVFLTELTSNTATAATLLPVVASLAAASGMDPLLLTVPTALGASCAFMLPVATPPNAMVYGSRRIAMAHMVRAGLALNLVFIVLLTVITLVLVPRILPVR